MVLYGKIKLDVVVSEVVESSSVLVLKKSPPMRSIPAGLCQDTWPPRPSDREWDCSHSPSKVWQLASPVYPAIVYVSPPHAVREDWVCPCRPDAGNLGREQLRSPGSHTSAEAELLPPVMRRPDNTRTFV